MESLGIPDVKAAQAVYSVLIVNEAVGDRAHWSDQLRRRGYVVFEAGDADQALSLLNSKLDIHALVTDASIPGSMGGVALARWIRSTRPALRVVVLSDSDPDTSLLDEDIACVRKPLVAAEFFAALPSPNVGLP